MTIRLTLDEVVEIMREYLESLFPKICPNCSKVYNSYEEFLHETNSEGAPVNYDDEYDELTEHKEFLPLKPIGTCAFYQCVCGSTLALSSLKMPIMKYFRLLLWGRKYRKKNGLSLSEFMEKLQENVDQKYRVKENETSI